jgi:hypothetical protein
MSPTSGVKSRAIKRAMARELRDEMVVGEIVADQAPLRFRCALRSLTRCVFKTGVLLSRRAISQPKDHVGEVLRFADGSGGRVYRETIVDSAAVDAPVVLVVAFRLRWVRGWGHAFFRAESLLNTPLFVGFPGLVSKLWLAHDENDVYRGFYQWNQSRLADRYVRALWWVLALVSDHQSIHYVVLPGLRRDDVLADPDGSRRCRARRAARVVAARRRGARDVVTLSRAIPAVRRSTRPLPSGQSGRV